MSSIPEAVAKAEATLLASGAPFEIEQVTYLGERIDAFKNRAPHLRALVERSRSFGEREYFVFAWSGGERRVRYDEHAALVASVAASFRRDYGIGHGDRVAILSENRPEWLLSFWATVSLGAVAVGMNGWWTGDEIRYAIGDAEPKLLVADRKRLARLNGADVGIPVVVIEDDFAALETRHRGADLPETSISPEDAAIILYTSGTTGRPKGAVHTHFNVTSMVMTSAFHGARTIMSMAPADAPVAPAQPVALVTSPLFHVSGLHAAAVSSLSGGAKTVWPMGRFDPELTLGLIQRERVTGWGYTATILHRLLSFPRLADYDLSSMKLVGGGGSPIPPALQKRARALIPSTEFTLGVGYGLTEGTAFTCLAGGAELARYPESSGRPLPTIEVAIRDADGRDVEETVDGDIHVRGPLVMREYFRNPGATAEAILPGRWLRTGDVGCLRDGRIYLASRKRDLILRGGENVYPAEIEQRLEEHPNVVEAAVVGVDHVELGQEVKAVVVAAGEPPNPEALARFVGETLAYFKVPAHWEFRSEPLPRNATGKVLKHLLSAGSTAQFIEE